MRYVVRGIMVALVSALVSAVAAVAQSSTPAGEVAALRDVYARALARIEAEYRAEVEAVPVRYAEAIAVLQVQTRQAGDLDGLMAATREHERLTREKTLPVRPDPAQVALAAVQKRFLAAEAACAATRSAKVMDLIAKYTARLEVGRKAMTVENRIELALLYDQEIKRVRESPEAATAAFDLAATPTAPPPDTSPPAGGESSSVSIARAGAPSAPAIVGASRAKLYPGQGPALPDAFLKRIGLRPTPLAGLGASVSAVAMLGRKSDIARDSQTTTYSTSLSTSGSVSHYLRLNLRTRSVDVVLDRPTVVVQYFTRDTNKSTGRIVPERAAVELVVLSRLDTNLVTLDLPPQSLSQQSSTYRSAYYTTSSSSGRDLYGVIITVVDADGGIVFQSSSIQSLDSFGQTAVEEAREAARRQEREVARLEYEAARDAYYLKVSDGALRAKYQEAQTRYYNLQRAEAAPLAAP